ncbi:hypothetical protein K461DRAFT_202612, partial [Myriangium duriaei CBS 260.36]
ASTSCPRSLSPVNDTNAPLIFNSIIDSMRQFGESLHHNGMSLFLAHVPKGTEFYRGTVNKKTVKHLQWLAFEPEHALGVVRGRQQNKTTSYLQTYRTRSALRLIYIDGQSAAKSTKGVLDTQDIIIRDPNKPKPPPPPGGLPPGAMGDSERAAEMCQVAAKTWKGRIDGVIRMQGGFEVILCSNIFKLRIVSVDVLDPSIKQNVMNFYLAIAARYDGIGDHRVDLDYDSMVSLYAYPDLVYIDKNGLPRANVHSKSLSKAKSDLRATAMSRSKAGHDWQAIGDMFVARYGDKIQYLASGNVKTLSDLHTQVDLAAEPFVNFRDPDQNDEIWACARQFWPEDLRFYFWCPMLLNVPAAAFRGVAFRVCEAFVNARKATDLNKAVNDFKTLEKWLDWASFKTCRGCAYNAVCMPPIWPWGNKQDFLQPQCRTSLDGLMGGKDWY